MPCDVGRRKNEQDDRQSTNCYRQKYAVELSYHIYLVMPSNTAGCNTCIAKVEIGTVLEFVRTVKFTVQYCTVPIQQ